MAILPCSSRTLGQIAGGAGFPESIRGVLQLPDYHEAGYHGRSAR
jgi:hypothetical protein